VIIYEGLRLIGYFISRYDLHITVTIAHYESTDKAGHGDGHVKPAGSGGLLTACDGIVSQGDIK
jgi:hypothetical protein